MDDSPLDYTDPHFVYKVRPEHITMTFIAKAFGVTGDKKAPVLPANTKVVIDSKLVDQYDSPLKLFPNYQKDLAGKETTVGRVCVNVFLSWTPFSFTDSKKQKKEGNLITLVNYVNEPFTKKVLGRYDKVIADLFLDEVVGADLMTELINKEQWLGYTGSNFLLPSLDLATIDISDDIREYRDKLLKENAKAIREKDLVVFDKIEKDILAFAAKSLKAQGATGKIIYDSGFNGTWNNNFKTTSIMRGISPKSDAVNEFEITTSNLVDGIKKEDLASHADIAVLGAAGRAKDTQLGGYKTKIFGAAFASMVAGDKGSDCKTTRTIDVVLPPNFEEYRYRNIVTPKGIVNLTKENYGEYMGKKVKLRSPIECKSEKICNVCLGDMFYKLGTRNIGLHTTRITTSQMNYSMKAFHNIAVTLKEYNIFDYISPIPQ